MNGICMNRGVGQYVALEAHCAIWRREARKGQEPLMISAQGSHGIANTLWVLANATARAYTETLARQGYFQIQGDLSQTLTQGTFGNDTSQTRLGQLKTFAQGSNSPLAVASGDALLHGGSGGGADAINYARANPSEVKAIALLQPLIDLEGLYTLVGAGFNGVSQSEINKAYNGGVDDGGTAYQAAKVAHNPSKHASECVDFPMKIWYVTDDVFIPIQTIMDFRDAVNGLGGSVEVSSLGAVGHGSYPPPLEVAEFFAEHV